VMNVVSYKKSEELIPESRAWSSDHRCAGEVERIRGKSSRFAFRRSSVYFHRLKASNSFYIIPYWSPAVSVAWNSSERPQLLF
jgi:hypothetical protein